MGSIFSISHPIEGKEEGYECCTKKLFLVIPLLYMAVNVQVQAREMGNVIATTAYAGFDIAGAETQKVILDSPATAVNKYSSHGDSYGEVDSTGMNTVNWLGYYNRVTQYIYEKYGVAGYTDQYNAVCNDKDAFINAYNNNEVLGFTYASCSTGNGVPKATMRHCMMSAHPAYLAICLLWALFIVAWLAVLVGYCWFTYSSHDIRWYISVSKFKHSIRNKAFVAIGFALTFLTSSIALYYVGAEGDDELPWGSALYGEDAVESLMKLFMFISINGMALMELSKTENYSFDHLSVSKDLPDPIIIVPCPEETKNVWNLWGGKQSVDEVLFMFEEAYLHQLLFKSSSSAKRMCSHGNEGTVEKVVKLMHADDLVQIVERAEKELETMATDAAHKEAIDAAGDMKALTDEQKVQLARKRTSAVFSKTGTKEFLRRSKLFLAPVALIMSNAVNLLMKISQNAVNTQYGGFETGDYAALAWPKETELVTFFDEVVLPGELGDVLGDYNISTDCSGWYDQLRNRQSVGLNTGACSDSVPRQVRMTELVCQYTSTGLFASTVTIWSIYGATMLGFLWYNYRDFDSDDLRFHLTSDCMKFNPFFRGLMNTGYLLMVATFFLALGYESSRDTAQWNDIASVFIFLFLMLKSFAALDGPSYVEFADADNSNIISVIDQYPEKIPLVMKHYSERGIMNLWGIMTPPTNTVFSHLITAYLKALVMDDERIFVTHMVDFDDATAVLMKLDKADISIATASGKVIGASAVKVLEEEEEDVEQGVVTGKGKGPDNRLLVAVADADAADTGDVELVLSNNNNGDNYAEETSSNEPVAAPAPAHVAAVEENSDSSMSEPSAKEAAAAVDNNDDDDDDAAAADMAKVAAEAVEASAIAADAAMDVREEEEVDGLVKKVKK